MIVPIGRAPGLAVSALLAMPAATLAQSTRTYPGPAPCETTLQACIAGSGWGDTIRIGPGEFLVENLTLDKPVSLVGAGRGADPENVTILRADGQRVLMITGASITSSTVISDLLVYAGYTAGPGGGIYVTGGAQPLITDVDVLQNQAQRGGGIAADGSLTLVNVRVLYNTAYGDGGGVHATGTLTVTGGYFEGNQATLGGGLRAFMLEATDTELIANTASQHGGGALVEFAADLTRGHLEANLAGGGGGGLYIARNEDDSTRVRVLGTTFRGNRAGQDGGAIASLGSAALVRARFEENASLGAGGGVHAETFSATDTDFINNRAHEGGGVSAFYPFAVSGALFAGNSATANGGGVHASQGGRIRRSRFIGNRAGAGSAGSGGGVFGSAPFDLDVIDITNTLFARNTAANRGAALYMEEGTLRHVTITDAAINPKEAIYVASSPPFGTMTVTNSIIARHSVGIETGGLPVTEDYNLFSDYSLDVVGAVTRGGHSFTGVPAFADPAADDYHLTPASDAIDAGTDAGIAEDFEWDVRPFGGGFDIGYDEWAVPSNLIFKDGFQSP